MAAPWTCSEARSGDATSSLCLTLHLIAREPAYGNRLIEEIEAITEGIISVNPNTIYPLLRDLEARGPDRGTVGASGPTDPALLLDHPGGAQGVPATGRRAGAVPRLGDPIRDPGQAGDIRVSQISESVVVEASLAEVWDYYFDSRGWPAWVDGFGRLQASDGYPGSGGSLRWSSIPAGRGEVTEHVLEHEPRRLHRVAFRDPTSAGELRTTFAIEGDGDAGHPAARLPAARAAARSPGSPIGCSSARRSAASSAARLDRLRREVGERSVAGPSTYSLAPCSCSRPRSLGAGTMGGEIAQVIASADVPVVIKDVKQELVDAGPREGPRGDPGTARQPGRQGEDRLRAGRRAAGRRSSG